MPRISPLKCGTMALAGDLGDFGIVDIIQLVDLGKKTGGVEVHGRRGSEQIDGWVFFNEGKICAAQLGALAGEEAVYTLFTCTSGPFKLHERMPLPPRNVYVSNEVVIMEGIGRQDDWASIAERVPPGNVVLKLVPNPRSSSREINLEADKWRVLTMINGKNTVADIVRLAGLGEYTTFKIIIELMNAGLIDGKAEEQQAVAIYPELEKLAVAAIGNSARTLLIDAFKRAGLKPDDASAQPQQVLKAVAGFEQATTLLLGPSRARSLADQLRTKIQQAHR